MKVDRLGESFTKLEMNQMLVIDKLQDKINLLEFDISKNLAEISVLKQKIKKRNESIEKIITELELIHKEKNYKNLWYVINCLKSTNKGDYNE